MHIGEQKFLWLQYNVIQKEQEKQATGKKDWTKVMGMTYERRYSANCFFVQILLLTSFVVSVVVFMEDKNIQCIQNWKCKLNANLHSLRSNSLL